MPQRLANTAQGRVDRGVVVILVACTLISITTISVFPRIPPKGALPASNHFRNLGIALRAYAARHDGLPRDQTAAPFRLQIQTNGDNPARVHVQAIAASADVWTRLSGDASVSFEDVLSFHVFRASAVAATDNDELPPMLGNYEFADQTLTFSPTFELTPGSQYIARLQLKPLAKFTDVKLADGQATLTEIHTAATPSDAVAPSVVGWYPSGRKLPANHLKFYVVFSEPMERGDIFRHLSLWDTTTATLVPRPFRHTELWSEDGRTLTLWFHPGRQKTGVNLNVEIGPILDTGCEYELRISQAWRSAVGIPFARQDTKSFAAVAADHVQPDIQLWTVTSPSAGSIEPLMVQFGESLDWALANRVIQIQTSDDRPLPGRLVVLDQEVGFEFLPEVEWRSGEYRLSVHPDLEDLAGNSVGRPFEVDVSQPRTTVDRGDHPVIRRFKVQ
ncbi:MAG: hypothetical protein O3A00_28545 [Planctomycetota bacterium]|nr:hypothetical protein [Planctomycetota bacterium]